MATSSRALTGIAIKALLVLCVSGLLALGRVAAAEAEQIAEAGKDTYTVYQTILGQNTSGQDIAGKDKAVAVSGDSPDTTGPAISIDEIATELSNPVTALASIYTDIEYRTFQGSLPEADDKISLVYRFRASIPIPLPSGKTIQMRATIPIVQEKPVWDVNVDDPIWEVDLDYAPFLVRQSPQITPSTGRFGHEHGHLDDTTLEFAYGGVSDTGFISMYGFAAVLPTSQDRSASRNQFLMGPELAFGKTTDWGLAGAWLKHLTTISGESRFNTNETSLNLFFAYGLGNGWQIFSNPSVIYDWEADSGNRLELPIGGGVSKTTRFGHTPLRLAVEVQHFVVSPDRLGPEWLFNFSFTPVFTNPFSK